MLRCAATIVLVLSAIFAAGCRSGADGPEVLTIDAASYNQAFDSAVRSARAAGFKPATLDRRAGVIETEPVIAASIFEPWRTDATSLANAFDQTLAMTRRRLRFEFSTPRTDPVAPPSDLLTGPDVVGIETAPVDLSAWDGAIELRVLAFMDQAHRPGDQLFAWTQYDDLRAERVVTYRFAEGDDATWGAELIRDPAFYWTPVARDPAYERSLLADVQRRLVPREQASSDAGPDED